MKLPLHSSQLESTENRQLERQWSLRSILSYSRSINDPVCRWLDRDTVSRNGIAAATVDFRASPPTQDLAISRFPYAPWKREVPFSLSLHPYSRLIPRLYFHDVCITQSYLGIQVFFFSLLYPLESRTQAALRNRDFIHRRAPRFPFHAADPIHRQALRRLFKFVTRAVSAGRARTESGGKASADGTRSATVLSRSRGGGDSRNDRWRQKRRSIADLEDD